MPLCTIQIKGHEKTWSFTTDVDLKYLPEWWADGLEIYELCNTIPVWVPRIGLTRIWCCVQDLLNFKWLHIPAYFGRKKR